MKKRNLFIAIGVFIIMALFVGVFFGCDKVPKYSLSLGESLSLEDKKINKEKIAQGTNVAILVTVPEKKQIKTLLVNTTERKQDITNNKITITIEEDTTISVEFENITNKLTLPAGVSLENTELDLNNIFTGTDVTLIFEIPEGHRIKTLIIDDLDLKTHLNNNKIVFKVKKDTVVVFETEEDPVLKLHKDFDIIKKMVSNEVMFTPNYTKEEMTFGQEFISLSVTKKEELKTLVTQFDALDDSTSFEQKVQIKNNAYQIIGDKVIERGTSDNFYFEFIPDKTIEHLIIAKNFRYFPGEITLIKAQAGIEFEYDVEMATNYDKVVFSPFKTIKNIETGDVEVEEEPIVEAPKERFNIYTYKMLSHVRVSVDANAVKTKRTVTYDDNIVNNYPTNVAMEKLEGNNWVAHEPSAGNYIPIHTKLRVKITGIPDTKIIMAYYNGKEIPIINDIANFKLLENTKFSMVVVDKVHFTIKPEDRSKFTFNKSSTLFETEEGFSTMKNGVVTFTFYTTEHFELKVLKEDFKIFTNENVEIIPTKIEQKEVDPLYKYTLRQYLVTFSARESGKFVLNETPIVHEIASSSYVLSPETEDFSTNPMKYISSTTLEDFTKVESGKNIEIIFKALPEGQLHYFAIGGAKIEVIDNKVTFSVTRPTTITYGILKTFKVTFDETVNVLDYLLFNDDEINGSRLEKDTIVYFWVLPKMADKVESISIGNDEFAVYNELSGQYSFKVTRDIIIKVILK